MGDKFSADFVGEFERMLGGGEEVLAFCSLFWLTGCGRVFCGGCSVGVSCSG